MSNRYLDAAWKVIGGLSTAEKIVLVRLADRADANGKSFAGRSSISRECCVDRRTVSRAFNRLTALGYLERQPTGAGAKGYGTSVSFLTAKIFDATSAKPPEEPSSETGIQPEAETPEPDDPPGDPAPEPEGAEIVKHPALELVPEEPQPKSTIHEDFEELWDQFPRRKGIRAGKKKAKEKYVRLIKSGKVSHAELLSAVLRYSAFCDTTQSLAADLATWLHNERWNDEIEPADSTPRATVETAHERRARKNDEAMREWLEMNNLNEEPTPGAAMLPNTHSN